MGNPDSTATKSVIVTNDPDRRYPEERLNVDGEQVEIPTKKYYLVSFSEGDLFPDKQFTEKLRDWLEDPSKPLNIFLINKDNEETFQISVMDSGQNNHALIFYPSNILASGESDTIEIFTDEHPKSQKFVNSVLATVLQQYISFYTDSKTFTVNGQQNGPTAFFKVIDGALYITGEGSHRIHTLTEGSPVELNEVLSELYS